MTRILTKELTNDLFNEIGARLVKENKTGEIAVYGGSCIMLVSNFRDTTGDVDATFYRGETEIRAIAEALAFKHDLPRDWLNGAVTRMARMPGNPEPKLTLYSEYPEGSACGLRVFVPTPEKILAMKMMINREADSEKIESDDSDIRHLIKLIGKASFSELRDLFMEHYPKIPGLTEPHLSNRMADKIHAHAESFKRNPPKLVPAWNPRRGGLER